MMLRTVLVLLACRDVVIDMLRGSGPNAKLKKAEILEAAKRKLKRDVTNNEYTKVEFILIRTTLSFTRFSYEIVIIYYLN